MAQVGNGGDPSTGDQQRNEARRPAGEPPVAVQAPATVPAPPVVPAPAAVPAPPAPAVPAPPAAVAPAQAQAAVVAALEAVPNVAALQVGGPDAVAFDVDRVLVPPGPLTKCTFGYVNYPPIPDDEAA